MWNKKTTDGIYKTVFQDLLSSYIDAIPTKNESYAQQLTEVHKEFVKRNKSLTGLLDDYIENRNSRVKENKLCKQIIFWVFLVVFLLLTGTVIYIFVKTDINESNAAVITSLVTVAATYLASILSIINIISKYLFPVDEEKDTIEMIKTVIGNDVQVEKMMAEAMDKAKYIDAQKLKDYKNLLTEGVITQEDFEYLKDSLINRPQK